MAGAADISGDPQPTSPMTADEMNSAQKANVNRTQQGPQSPLQAFQALAEGGKEKIQAGAKAVDNTIEGASKALRGEGKIQGGQGYENAPQDLAQIGRNYYSDALRAMGELDLSELD